MSAEETKFDIWWNSPSVRRMVGIIYSLGASVVIIGAMFKILHLQFASEVLGTGMTVEAVLFALGIFDKPHKEYEWDKIFHFEQGVMHQLSGNTGSLSAVNGGGGNKSINYTESISDEDVVKLSDGIKNLSNTAQQLTGLTNAVGATEAYTKNIDAASQIAGKFVQSQESLNSATTKLVASYQGISTDMEEVVKNTRNYDKKVEDINKNLASINSIYELQLKNIQTQTEGLTTQTDQVRQISAQLEAIVSDTLKMKVSNELATAEIEKYKDGTVKLSKQITDLNQVYGNMLNALN
ncbi:MAG: gliding motility protein GldL [Paludibacter sp.]|nr:gliding motility protein GldL [Paludibacter sp.]